MYIPEFKYKGFDSLWYEWRPLPFPKPALQYGWNGWDSVNHAWEFGHPSGLKAVCGLDMGCSNGSRIMPLCPECEKALANGENKSFTGFSDFYKAHQAYLKEVSEIQQRRAEKSKRLHRLRLEHTAAVCDISPITNHMPVAALKELKKAAERIFKKYRKSEFKDNK